MLVCGHEISVKNEYIRRKRRETGAFFLLFMQVKANTLVEITGFFGKIEGKVNDVPQKTSG